MKLIEPSSLDEFMNIYNKYLSSGENYYRGQANFAWNIIPTLARNKEISSLLEIENKLLVKFQQKIKENNLEFLIPKVDCYDYSWIILMAAQHYGLPTRLLDFTHDKIISILFAVADIEYLNKDGALIIYYNPNGIQKNLDIFNDSFTGKFEESFFIPAPKLSGIENNELRLSEWIFR